MIAAWMLYCVAIGLALTVVGVALERGLHLAGRPSRWAWVVALAGSFAIPAAAWLRPEAFSTLAVPFPATSVADPAIAQAPASVDAVETTGIAATSPFSLRDLDVVLRWGWTASSILLLCVLGASALRFAALRRRWRFSSVDGRRVLVSDNVGPAVAGLWRPVVIVPGWALALDQSQRRLMLSHEEEHLRAADPWLLAFGAAALVLMPWNPALWWQVRRLRLAVEIDCDARVLAGGGTTPEYGELLLQVGYRRRQFALAAPALGEPVSFLERRIHRMATTLPRWRWVGAAAAAVVAVGAIAGACEAPRPVNEDSRTPESSVDLVVQGPSTLEGVPSRSVLIRWMRSAIAQEYAEYLTTPANPSVDLWFHGTTGGRVVRSTRTGRTVARLLRAGEVEAHLPEVGPRRPGTWFGWAYPLGPDREDVRAIWVDDRGDSSSVTAQGQGQAGDLSAFDEHPEILVLPWIRDGITRFYPALLQERSGPRIELWFVADPQKHVVRTVQRAGPDVLRVGIDDIHAVFPDLDESNVEGWRIAQGRGLGRLVRDNVRVVWIQLRAGKTISGTVPTAAPAVPAPTRAPYGRPTLSWSPAPVYPALLRSAGIRGRVVVQAIIGETGRAETASVKIVESPHPGFNQAAKDWMLAARFAPARVQGRAVRALVNVPVEFAID